MQLRSASFTSTLGNFETETDLPVEKAVFPFIGGLFQHGL
jgi:hypothetical protein